MGDIPLKKGTSRTDTDTSILRSNKTFFQPLAGDFEAPTRPVMPRRNPVDLESVTRFEDYNSAPEERKVIAGGSPRCAVCYANLKGKPQDWRVAHFNACWDKMRKVAGRNAKPRKHMIPSQRPLDVQQALCVSTEDTSIELPPCILCDIRLVGMTPIDAFEHRICCQRGLNRLDTCPSCNTLFATDGFPWVETRIAEHLYTCSVSASADDFETLQDEWLDQRYMHKHPANCALCTKDLRILDVIDAFHHRYECVKKLDREQCPICLKRLQAIDRQDSRTIDKTLWHLHDCQHDNALSEIEKDDFDALAWRHKGRLQCS